MSSGRAGFAASRTPQTHLFDTTFWQVLPTYYTKISSRWDIIARLYHEASSALLATDRDSGTNSLRAELDMLEHEIAEYRDVVAGIGVEDVVGVYMVAGRQVWRARQIAEEDFEGFEGSLKEIEERVREIRADVVYGFGET